MKERTAGSRRKRVPKKTAAKTPPPFRLTSIAPAIAGILTTIVFFAFGDTFLADLSNHLRTVVLFAFLFGVMMWCAFAVVTHADAVAEYLGEPYGTLILTLSVIVIEVALLASIMIHGENNPTLARDAMFATLMIVLNGMVGIALLIGALRYWEQDYNLAGARSFLVVITALSVFALILPNYTKTPPDPINAPGKAWMFLAVTLLFYGVFLAIQTLRHRAFFDEPAEAVAASPKRGDRKATTGSLAYHVAMLILSLLPVVLLAEYLAVIVDYGIEDLDLPDELGGILIAILVLAPEALTAFHAALANRLQRAVNVCLGSALSTIGLTIPAVLLIGMVTGRDVHLGLTGTETVLLVLTLFISGLTFGGGRTNVLQGVVHLLLFFVYILLIFSP
ncbi:MAG: calcium:proton antiporter [Methyloceanibacter sp.]